MVDKTNSETKILSLILANIKKGKASLTKLEDWNILLLRKSWTRDNLRAVLSHLEENAFTGQFLIKGYEGNGKTQLIYFLKEKLEEVGKNIIYIDSFQKFEEFLANPSEFVKKGDNLIILDNIDNELIREMEKFSFLYSKLISLVREKKLLSIAIILSIRTETLMRIKSENKNIASILESHKIILDLDLSKADLLLYAKDASSKFPKIIRFEKEAYTRLVRGYLFSILTYFININRITNLRNLILAALDEIDFVCKSLQIPKKEETVLKVSRKIKLIKNRIFDTVGRFLSNYYEEISLAAYKLKLGVEKIEKIDGDGILLSLRVDCIDYCNNLKAAKAMINVYLEKETSIDKQKLNDSLPHKFNIILNGEEEKSEAYYGNQIHLPLKILKYTTIISSEDTYKLILDKLGLGEKLKLFLNLIAFAHTIKSFEEKNVVSREGFIEIASWASIYMFLKVFMSTRSVFLEIIQVKSFFENYIDSFLANLKLDKRLVDDLFNSLLSSMQRMNLIIVSGSEVLPNWNKFRILQEIVNKIANEISFRLKFYLL